MEECENNYLNTSRIIIILPLHFPDAFRSTNYNHIVPIVSTVSINDIGYRHLQIKDIHVYVCNLIIFLILFVSAIALSKFLINPLIFLCFFSNSSYYLSVFMQIVQRKMYSSSSAWDPLFLLPFILFYNVLLPTYLLLAIMGGTWIAMLCLYTLTHHAQATMVSNRHQCNLAIY